MSSDEPSTSTPFQIMGRLETRWNGRNRVHSLHRQETLLHQQRIRALIELATEYARDPTDQTITALLQHAATFRE